MNKTESVIVASVVSFCLGALFVAILHSWVVGELRDQARMANAGRYEVDQETGEASFVFGCQETPDPIPMPFGNWPHLDGVANTGGTFTEVKKDTCQCCK